MNITLCVSMPNNGLRMLSHLASTARRSSSGENSISLRITCHDEEQQASISSARIDLPVEETILIEREPNSYRHANSVTHSRCVNQLFKRTTSDIAVICDYDGAIVYKDWDKLLVEKIIRNNVEFLGSPYSPRLASLFQVGDSKFPCLKYQNNPNCIFLAYSPRRIKKITNKLCEFCDTYNSADSIPIRFISCRRESEIYGIHIGHFVSLDTGSRVPELIRDHKLQVFNLTRMASAYQVFGIPDSEERGNDGLLHPEEYCLDGVPFFVHYRKGSSKEGLIASQVDYQPDDFYRDVNNYLSTNG